MIKAIAIDDEPKAIKVIEHHISKMDSIMLISYFHNAKEAIEFLKQNPIDLIFLDINMPHMSGLEMLDELQLKPLIIFTTAYTKFAFESYTYNAIDYLLKPFEFDRFQIALNKAENRIKSLKTEQSYFFIKDGIKTIKIEFDTILFIKSAGNYLDITSKEKTFTTRMTFVELVEKIPSSKFARVHQSYMVNISNIDRIENNQVFIETYNIPISNKYKEVFLKQITP